MSSEGLGKVQTGVKEQQDWVMGSAGGGKKGREGCGTDLSAASAVRAAQPWHCADLKWVWLCQTSPGPVQDVWTPSLGCNGDNRGFSEFWLCSLRGSGCYLSCTSPYLPVSGQKDGKFLNGAGTSECLVAALQRRVMSPKK